MTQFGSPNPFEVLAKDWAMEMAAALGYKPEDANRYVLGLHLRHVYGPSERVIVGLSHSAAQKDKAETILVENETQQLHLLNHVLDSLHYDPVRRDEQPLTECTAICLRITYRLRADHCHYFEALRDLQNEPVTLPQGAEVTKPYSPWAEKPVALSIGGNSVPIKTFHMAARNYEKIQYRRRPLAERPIIDDDLDDGDLRKCLCTEFLCGCQKLCAELDLPSSPLAYRSLTGGVYSLSKYAATGAFGEETVTLMLRSRFPLGFALGFTLVSDVAPTLAKFNEASAILAKYFHWLHEGPRMLAKKENTSDEEKAVRKRIEGLNFNKIDEKKFFSVAPPRDLIKHLVDHLPDSKNSSVLASQWMQANRSGPIRNFLQITSLFSDEQFEGHPLRFGLLLGNAALLKFWPGPRPILLNDNSNRTTAKELAKQIHLLENPSQQCLVLGYPREHASPDDHLDAWLIELGDFGIGLGTWQQMRIWDQDLAPYAYLTAHYPWAVAAVVGPGSEIRVLSGGKLRAFRNGKGWWRVVEPRPDAYSHEEPEFAKWLSSLDANMNAVLTAVWTLSLQTSSFARTGAHGGLFVFVPQKEGDDERFWASQKGHLLPLRDLDPQDNGRYWLKEHKLLPMEGTLDCAVGSKILRAALLDGAIVLYGPQGAVRYFGRQLAYVDPARVREGEVTGTKRANALAFVEAMASPPANRLQAFAIAVSSDGPIRLFYWNQESGAAEVVELFGQVTDED